MAKVTLVPGLEVCLCPETHGDFPEGQGSRLHPLKGSLPEKGQGSQ